MCSKVSQKTVEHSNERGYKSIYHTHGKMQNQPLDFEAGRAALDRETGRAALDRKTDRDAVDRETDRAAVD